MATHKRFDSLEQEIDLVKRAQAGDSQAAEKLVDAYEGIVRKHIRRYVRPNDPRYEDLLQEGRIQILLLLRSFDRTKGSFSTYAYRKLKSTLATEFNRMINPVKVPIRYLRDPDYWFTAFSFDDGHPDAFARVFRTTWESHMHNRLLAEKLLAACHKVIMGTPGIMKPKQMWDIFYRYNTQEITMKEIAAEYGVSKQGVDHFLKRALRIIQNRVRYDNGSFIVRDASADADNQESNRRS